MKIGAADIGASNMGLCTWDGAQFRASSWFPSISASGTAIDYEEEARRLSQWREYFWAWLIGEKIQHLAIETPLRSDMTRLEEGDHGQKERVAATSMKTVWRIYSNTSAAFEIAGRLNVPVSAIHGSTWKKSFLGVIHAPKIDDDGTLVKDGRKWLKKRARRECEKINVKVRNDDQGDAVGICWTLRGLLHLDGVGGKPGDLFADRAA